MPQGMLAIVAIAIVILFIQFVIENWVYILISISVIIFIIVIIVRLVSPSKEQVAKEKERLIDEVERHRSALIRNLDRALKINDYNAIVKDNRDKVLEDFFGSIDFDIKILGFELARTITFKQLEEIQIKDIEKGFNPADMPIDGHEFEYWVAQSLNKFGWEARVTSGSGDQGIDVIAEMHGMKIGLQCKRFNSSVGNKAVQEVYAGKAFHQVDEVGVISNASYTKSAKALAADTGVKLLSHHDIPNLYDKMFY